MSATVITISSGKGGVGKTTTTANLAVALALNNQKVVCIDGDIGFSNDWFNTNFYWDIIHTMHHTNHSSIF